MHAHNPAAPAMGALGMLGALGLAARADGRQVCVQTRTETVDVMVPVSRPLTFRPRSASR